jgi:hypothetical protein
MAKMQVHYIRNIFSPTAASLQLKNVAATFTLASDGEKMPWKKCAREQQNDPKCTSWPNG